MYQLHTVVEGVCYTCIYVKSCVRVAVVFECGRHVFVVVCGGMIKVYDTHIYVHGTVVMPCGADLHCLSVHSLKPCG